MHDIGEKPGQGTYQCTSCSKWKVNLDDDDDKLPPCANCGEGQHVKYVRV